MKYSTTAAAIVVATLSTTASADVVAGFSFNSLGSSGIPVPAAYAADHGTGTYSTSFFETEVVHFSGTTLGAVEGDASGRGAAFRVGEGARNNGAYAQFAIDTTGFGDLMLSFATKTTANTGFTDAEILVSANGVDFTSVDTFTNLRDDLNWVLKTVDLTGIAAIENNPNAAFRVVFTGGDASNPVANSRIDNFVIQGSAIPTPGSIALLGLSGAVATRRRRA